MVTNIELARIAEARRAKERYEEMHWEIATDGGTNLVIDPRLREETVCAAVCEATGLARDQWLNMTVLQRLPYLERAAPKLTPTEARARFCFSEWEAGATLKEINAALRKNAEWEHFEDYGNVRGAIKSWGKRVGVEPRTGQPGRKSSK